MSLLPNLRRRNQDLDEEVQAHFRMAIRENMEGGMSEKQATAAARREFGNVDLFKATTQEVWGWTGLERLRQDIEFGVRMLRKSPSFTAVAAITLALGIGANTAIFSVINGVLIRSLPFPNARELVWIGNGFDEAGLSGRTHTSFDYRDFRERSRTISGMAAYNAFFPYNSYNLTGRGDPERPIGVDVTCNFFPVLGVMPLVGRNFTAEECVRHGPLAVILSNAYWKTRFASNPGIVGSAPDDQWRISDGGWRFAALLRLRLGVCSGRKGRYVSAALYRQGHRQSRQRSIHRRPDQAWPPVESGAG